ncbi:MAG TPA: endonuclease domain-containing protein [Rhizomicrobium sp.]|nr:endonuclease domain-containing protein [Rhizomicrobium sp.]
MPTERSKQFHRAHARDLRGNATGPERWLWLALRDSQTGARFRRQQPIGPYIADFCCLPLKLVIELDGSQHQLPDATARDEERTRYLTEQGCRVLRFQNSEVLTERARVMDVIVHAVGSSSPSPKNASRFSTLPQGEGGN